MIFNNFKRIVIGDKGLILKFKNKEPKVISFSEINKIFIKVKKVPVKYIVLFVGLSLCVVLLLLWIYGFNLVAFSPFFLILVGVIKLNSYKTYVLKIKLKNGSSVIQPIPLKSKNKTIEDIYLVRKVLLGIY
jgi:predicted membrane metal-binding protein